MKNKIKKIAPVVILLVMLTAFVSGAMGQIVNNELNKSRYGNQELPSEKTLKEISPQPKILRGFGDSGSDGFDTGGTDNPGGYNDGAPVGEGIIIFLLLAVGYSLILLFNSRKDTESITMNVPTNKTKNMNEKSANRRIRYVLAGIIFLFIGMTTSLHAQVAIGDDVVSRKGLILDLKKTTPTGYIGGLMLPNVEILDLDKIPTAFTDASVKNLETNLDLAGMIVYNTKADPVKKIVVGCYMWGGRDWKLLVAAADK